MAKKSDSVEWELGQEVRLFNGTLRKLRLERGLTGKEVADVIGISQCTLYSYENMRSLPSEETAKKIGKFYGKKPEEIFPREFLKMFKTGTYERRQIAYAKAELKQLEASQAYAEKHTHLLEETTDPEKTLEKREAIIALRKFIADTLTDREYRIICMRFGLDGNPPMTLEDVGKEFDVSRDRIRQIETKALNRLRRNAASDGILFARDTILECEPDDNAVKIGKISVKKKEQKYSLKDLVGGNI